MGFYQPSEKKKKAFNNAIERMPENMTNNDLSAFICGLFKVYDIKGDQRRMLILGLAMQEHDDDDDDDEDDVGVGVEIDFNDPKLSAIFKGGA
tara:strand:- start:150 stop:428 length:279 start_codon:yes stop_codon:yes gene_type:complete